MTEYCPVTGEIYCRCAVPKPHITAIQVDLKAALRKLFTDHAVYTTFVLNNIIDGIDDGGVFAARTLENQEDIGAQIAPIIGQSASNELISLLKEHIQLAAAVITAISVDDQQLVLKTNTLFKNSDKTAAFLTSLNPEKLPYETTKSMFRKHNQDVADMTIARKNKDYQTQITIYDGYFNQIMELSDAIYDALP